MKKSALDIVNKEGVQEIFYTELSRYFADGKVKGDTYIGDIVSSLFETVETDNKNRVQNFKEILGIAERTQKYMDAKKVEEADYTQWLIRKGLLLWQKKLYDDSCKLISTLAGRRSGKTYGIGSKGLAHCLEPPDIYNINGVVTQKPKITYYIGLTVEKAAAIMWEPLKQRIKDCHIKTRKIDNSDYTVYFTNGSIFKLVGNSSKAEREKLRGLDISCAIIDEMQSQVGVQYLIESIIQPQLKARNGTLILAGTAPLTAGTFWEMVQKNDTYSHYHATMEDNETIPDRFNALQSVLDENGWTADNITFRREYLGEIAYDSNLLIYPRKSYVSKMPTSFDGAWIGLDLGWTDSTALVTLLSAGGVLYEKSTWQKPHMLASDIIKAVKNEIKLVQETCNIPLEDIHVVTDVNEQNVTRELYMEIPSIQEAYKQNQEYQINRVRDALEGGRLFIQKDGIIDKECNSFSWTWDGTLEAVLYKIDDTVRDVFGGHHDALDALQYAANAYWTYNA
jgi:hypothetical protein